MMKIGTSGFRGVIAEDFTKENIVKIAQCLSNNILKNNFKKQVIIGYDNRFMSEIFAKWLAEIFAANNIKVNITESSVPTPLVSYATKISGNDIGVMVTASHNPYMYNGLKIFEKEGRELQPWLENVLNTEPEKITNIKKINFEEAVKRGLISYKNFTEEYIKSIVSFIKYKQNLNIKAVFNVMNGSSLCAIENLKKVLKLDNLKIINTNRDALFNLNGPIPTEDNLQNFKKFALENNYEIAFATDGDGDRMSLFDEKGNFYNGNEINTLLYYFIIKEKGLKGGFVKNASFSSIIDKLSKKLGFDVFETKVGFKNITDCLIKNKALVGAENSGCEINGHVYVKDGVIVFALLLEIINYYKMPLSEIFKNLKREAGYNMQYLEYSYKVLNKEKIIQYLTETTPKFSKKIVKTSVLDGFKYYFEDGSWLLIRFSGTENLLRLVIEENSKKDLEKTLLETKKIIEGILK